ncbi:MAG: fructose 1,6-bisphosphatase, partial [Gemmatimonadota bacterium]
MPKDKTTLSCIKADIGGFVGHSAIHPALLEDAEAQLERARDRGFLIDFRVTYCGDDLNLILTHDQGEDSSEVHGLAWHVFESGTEIAKKLKLYGAGQDLLADAFSGNIRGMGP